MRAACFRQGSESAEALKENYTQIDNTLLRSLCILKPNQAKVMLFFIRFTMGFHRAGFICSCGDISGWCGISRANAQKVVKDLEKLSLLRVVSNKPKLSVIIDPQALTASIIRLRGEYLAKQLSDEKTCE